MNETTSDVQATESETTAPKKSRRGFASMTREQISAIARKGGQAAHAAGTAHRFTTEEAQAAGKKGGVAKHKSRGRTPVAELAVLPEEST